MRTKFAQTVNTKGKKFFAISLCVALVLSLGTGVVLAVNASQNDKPVFHVVTNEEYAAILSGKISLDDGIPRIWNNPDMQEQVGITEHEPGFSTVADVEREFFAVTDEESEFHVVTDEEYVAILSGEISLDDGVPRIWSNPDMQGQIGISRPK